MWIGVDDDVSAFCEYMNALHLDQKSYHLNSGSVMRLMKKMLLWFSNLMMTMDGDKISAKFARFSVVAFFEFFMSPIS